MASGFDQAKFLNVAAAKLVYAVQNKQHEDFKRLIDVIEKVSPPHAFAAAEGAFLYAGGIRPKDPVMMAIANDAFKFMCALLFKHDFDRPQIPNSEEFPVFPGQIRLPRSSAVSDIVPRPADPSFKGLVT